MVIINNCLIIAGEKSGEEHCLSFFSELVKLCPNVKFWGVGGDELQQNGMELIYHLNDFSNVGWSEVILKIPFYFRALKKIELLTKERKCKTAILIDFQDFNLRLAKRLKKNGVEVLYYVAPQAWAWKEKRVENLRKTVHTLFTILPFEQRWFTERGVRQVRPVNHPLWFKFQKHLLLHKEQELGNSKVKRIVFFPGSRNSEVRNLLPVYVKALKRAKKDYSIFSSIVVTSSVGSDNYQGYLGFFDKIYQSDQLKEALSSCDYAVATSGTITLATAMFSIPTIVSYKVSFFNELVFTVFVKYRNKISLGNIVLEKKVFPELIQESVTPLNIFNCLKYWFENKNEVQRVKKILGETKHLVSNSKLNVPKYMAEVINKVT